MQLYQYTDDIIDKLDIYAQSLLVQPRVTYELLHPEVFVPAGYLPIKIVQFSRNGSTVNKPSDYHWAIYIPLCHTPWIGNYYELAGDPQSLHVQTTVNNYNTRRGMERGSHIVGFILPLMLPQMEICFSRVLAQNPARQFWNSQNWAFIALMGLNYQSMFYIGTTMERLVGQMEIVSSAWEAGGAREPLGMTTRVNQPFRHKRM